MMKNRGKPPKLRKEMTQRDKNCYKKAVAGPLPTVGFGPAYRENVLYQRVPTGKGTGEGVEMVNGIE